LVRRNGRAHRTRPDHASVEHLVSRASGGTDDPENLRDSCARCNSLVGDWPLGRKLRFRRLIRDLGGWSGLTARFGRPGRGRQQRLVAQLDAMELPDDPESLRVRQLLPREEPAEPAGEGGAEGEGGDAAPSGPERVVVDAGPWLRATGRELRDTTKGPWWFEIDGHCWQAGGLRKRYDYAVRRAAGRARKLGVSRITLMMPPGAEDPEERSQVEVDTLSPFC
jgi:hypothetical protein